MKFPLQVDVDGNGKLDFKEFILLMTTHFDSINAECELKTAFQVINKSIGKTKHFLKSCKMYILDISPSEINCKFKHLTLHI